METLFWRVGDSFINSDVQTRVIRCDLRVKEPFHSNGQWLLSTQDTIGPCEQLCLEHISGHAAIVVMSVTRCCRPVRHSGLVKEELWA
jgi:hypothetical protein